MKICDLHGLRFEEGKEKIINILNSCMLEHESSVQIIHGYHGNVFKTYIHSQEFLEDLQEEGICINGMDGSKNPGSTDITLDL